MTGSPHQYALQYKAGTLSRGLLNVDEQKELDFIEEFYKTRFAKLAEEPGYVPGSTSSQRKFDALTIREYEDLDVFWTQAIERAKEDAFIQKIATEVIRQLKEGGFVK